MRTLSAISVSTGASSSERGAATPSTGTQPTERQALCPVTTRSSSQSQRVSARILASRRQVNEQYRKRAPQNNRMQLTRSTLLRAIRCRRGPADPRVRRTQKRPRMADRQRRRDGYATRLGYLDKGSARGTFRVNTVGENLVAMAMPDSSAADTPPRKRPGRKTGPRTPKARRKTTRSRTT